MLHFLETPAGGSSGLSLLLVIGGFVLFFWFFILRPQKKQDRETNEMRNNLAVGDEVTTIGGIIGKIVSIKEETLVLEKIGRAHV